MQSFSIILKNEKYRLYDKFAVFIFLLNAAGVVFAFYLKSQTWLTGSTGITSFLALVLAVILYMKQPQKVKKEYFFLFATLSTALYWVLLGFWWIGLLVALLAVLYTVSKKILVVKISEQHIEYPSFPTQIIPWNKTNNIVLKDGLLTIDLKNNKLIQQPIDEKKTTVNEQEFNDFCRQQMKK